MYNLTLHQVPCISAEESPSKKAKILSSRYLRRKKFAYSEDISHKHYVARFGLLKWILHAYSKHLIRKVHHHTYLCVRDLNQLGNLLLHILGFSQIRITVLNFFLALCFMKLLNVLLPQGIFLFRKVHCSREKFYTKLSRLMVYMPIYISQYNILEKYLVQIKNICKDFSNYVIPPPQFLSKSNSFKGKILNRAKWSHL